MLRRNFAWTTTIKPRMRPFVHHKPCKLRGDVGITSIRGGRARTILLQLQSLETCLLFPSARLTIFIDHRVASSMVVVCSAALQVSNAGSTTHQDNFKQWDLAPRREGLGVAIVGNRFYTFIPAQKPLPAAAKQVKRSARHCFTAAVATFAPTIPRSLGPGIIQTTLVVTLLICRHSQP